jgi:hypothetical protein
MISQREFESLLVEYFDEGPVQVADHVIDDALAAIDQKVNPRSQSMNLLARLATAAAIGLLAVVALMYFSRPAVFPGATATPTDTSPASSLSPSDAPSTPEFKPRPPAPETSPRSTLPRLDLPGFGDTGQPADDFGWTGQKGSSDWIHHVGRSQQIIFAVQDDCFGAANGEEPVSRSVAGFDGLYLEPYDVASLPHEIGRGSVEVATAGAYSLAVADRTLCVYLIWDVEKTTAEELSVGRDVVESIRAEPHGADGIRIVFTSAGWDDA